VHLLVWIMNCARCTVHTSTWNTLKELFRFTVPYEHDIARSFQAHGFIVWSAIVNRKCHVWMHIKWSKILLLNKLINIFRWMWYENSKTPWQYSRSGVLFGRRSSHVIINFKWKPIGKGGFYLNFENSIMVTPCINEIKCFIVQPVHSII